MKESWERTNKNIQIKDEIFRSMISQVFQGKRLISAERTETGLSSGTYKIQIEGVAEPFLLRISSESSDIASKENAISEKLKGIVPVANYIHLDTSRNLIDYDWAILEWKEGVLLRDILKNGENTQKIQAAESVGKVLARIHSNTFDRSGFLAGNLTISTPFQMGGDEFYSFISECLDQPTTIQWLGKEMIEKVRSFCMLHRSLLSEVHEPPVLVHSDFNGLNILMLDRPAGIEVSAVLDWEFAFSGRRYVDFGNLLRYEAENSLFKRHFIKAYQESGGLLNTNWEKLSKLEDLIALCDLLNRSTSEMPNRISDLKRLIVGTVQYDR